MCQPSWDMLRAAMMTSSVMLFCAFIILIDIGHVNIHNYYLFRCAVELSTAPAGILLIASVGTVFIQETEEKRG